MVLIYNYMQKLSLFFSPSWTVLNWSLTIVLESLVTRKFTNPGAAREAGSAQTDWRKHCRQNLAIVS